MYFHVFYPRSKKNLILLAENVFTVLWSWPYYYSYVTIPYTYINITLQCLPCLLLLLRWVFLSKPWKCLNSSCVLHLQANYVLETDEQLEAEKEEYDVILALSITKWIHLNWGDVGLKRFFRRIFRQLRPGGRLVLEPQAWPSYKRKKNLTVSRLKRFVDVCRDAKCEASG